jgi:carbon-monoxide dehydrogenase medium subunit
VRATALKPDELITDISFDPLMEHERGVFVKLGLRQAVNISVVNAAVVLAFDGLRVERARIALGSVAPTIIRAREAEAALRGQVLDAALIERAATLAMSEARPIDDVRASGSYRQGMVRLLVERALVQLRDGTERDSWPLNVPRLWGATNGHFPLRHREDSTFATGDGQPLEVTVNGQFHAVPGAHGKTLLQVLRDDLGLTGTKEGCSEGECGACTVLLDGIAVLSCLLPAPRAHGGSITTVEGLARDGTLSPLQQAFVDEGAVQCGYCTPGFLMAAEALLAEEPLPSRDSIRQALTGNLCRCTGYYKIIQAIEHAAQQRTLPQEVAHD